MQYSIFPPKNYIYFFVEGKRYVRVATNVFNETINNNLVKAVEIYPEKFGKHDTNLVLEALYNIAPIGDLEYFKSLLSEENFAYTFDLGNLSNEKVLRIDLFRIDKGTEFVGGIFHAFKHFNYNGSPLSTDKGETKIGHPKFLIENAVDAFYNYEFQFGNKPKTFVSFSEFNGKKLQFVFYKDTHDSDLKWMYTLLILFE